MIYCVSRTYSKTKEIQHQKHSSISTMITKPPETNNISIHDLYVSNNMMLSLLTLSEQESKQQIHSNTQQEDNQFYSYRQSLQKQVIERKIKKNYDLEPITRENNSIQSIQIPEQIEHDQNRRQSSRTVPNIITKSQQCIQPLLFNSSSNEISIEKKYRLKQKEIFQDTNSISNVTDTETMIHIPMQFQPFQFKQ